MDFRVRQLWLQHFGYAEIVDTPPGVLCPGAKPVGPPGIDPFLVRIKMTECVDKAGVQKGGKFLSLLVGKTGVFSVGFWVFQIDFFMGYVQVSAENHRFCLFQAL